MSNTTQVFLEYSRFWYSSTTFKSSTRVVTEVSMSIHNNIISFGKWFLIDLLYSNLHITQLLCKEICYKKVDGVEISPSCGSRLICSISWTHYPPDQAWNDCFPSLWRDNFPSRFPSWLRSTSRYTWKKRIRMRMKAACSGHGIHLFQCLST